MSKLFYFTIWREDSETVGINLKIQNQVRAFANMGLETYFCVSASNKVNVYEVVDKELRLKKEKQFSPKAAYREKDSFIKRKLSSTNRLKECLAFFDRMVEKNHPNYIYIRRILPITLLLAQKIKKWKNSGIHVIWEIPTWNSNPKTPYWILLHMQERLMYKILGDSIAQIVAIYSSSEKPPNNVMFINNGVNVEKIPVRQLKKHNGLNLICLATFSYWHGYDRLINGLGDYYQNKEKTMVINLHMVGNGNLDELKELARKRNVDQYIHFTGVLTGQELDEYFNKMDIAIGNLGFFRQGVFSDTSIKVREYCARGIPFITALSVNDFPEGWSYILHVPMDETFINIQDIINWFDSILATDYLTEMREYAENKLTWEKQLIEVINQVNSKLHK